MSKGIGGKIQKTAVGILIGLLVIGFAVWGVSDVFTPQTKNAVLSIGDVDISSQKFEDDFRRELQRRGRESGQQLTNQQAFDQGIHAQILQRMLTDAVISRVNLAKINSMKSWLRTGLPVNPSKRTSIIPCAANKPFPPLLPVLKLRWILRFSDINF